MSETEGVSADIVESILERRRPDAPENLYVEDLVLHASEFLFEHRFISDIGERFPCIRRENGSTAPIALWNFPPSGGPLLREPFGFSFLDYYRDRIERDEEEDGIVFVKPDVAKSYLRSGMIQFLISRMRSLSVSFDRSVQLINLQLPTSNFFGQRRARISTSGFRVDVSASPNLRVHVSPTFRRSWRFFASPTSPASGTLPGGIYEFAVDGGPYSTITPDAGTFDIPYTTVTPALTL